MNKIIFTLLGIYALTFSALCNSATLRYTSGKVSGINNVMIGGTAYDATFLDGSFNSSGTSKYSYRFANRATYAVIDLLKNKFSSSIFNTTPSETVGCNYSFSCYLATAYYTSSTGKTNYGVAVKNRLGTASRTAGYYRANTNYSNITNVNWAHSVSATPIPAAVWLMGSGFAGLMAFARKNKPQAAA